MYFRFYRFFSVGKLSYRNPQTFANGKYPVGESHIDEILVTQSVLKCICIYISLIEDD